MQSHLDEFDVLENVYSCELKSLSPVPVAESSPAHPNTKGAETSKIK